MELTESEFWDNYWANLVLPVKVDRDFSFDRCLANALRIHLRGVAGSVLEIGCAPGKWLAFLAEEFGLEPSGIEFSPVGGAATLRNLELLGVKVGAIRSCDFFEVVPDRQFDLVLSLGFIEHFTDVDEVIRRHLLWLKPGGLLVLGVPNFQGINWLVQYVLDPSILDKHNLNIMNPRYLAGLAERFPLTVKCIQYIGSFEPSLPIAPPGWRVAPRVLLVKVALRIVYLVRRLRVFDELNHPSFSSYLLAVYTKRNN
jgi:SAM-dependent methyltransferase